MVLDFYRKVNAFIKAGKACVIMVVIQSKGSSPGRIGFKMLVTDELLYGSIGGGIMEHKLVELCRSLLFKKDDKPFILHQIHKPDIPSNRSGMICSGEQYIAFYHLKENDRAWINLILDKERGTIIYTNAGVIYSNKIINHYSSEVKGSNKWYLDEPVLHKNKVFIIGGGHVGLALSEVLSRLDFEIHLLDDRDNLNTMVENTFAHSKKVIEYNQINQYIPEGENIYVVIISFGYKTDKLIVQQLLGKQYKYLGMMGSKTKIDTLLNELRAEGIPPEHLDKLYSPIGIDIKSETTQEIAISIAAQMIKIKNQG